jgi:hypothetical protein
MGPSQAVLISEVWGFPRASKNEILKKVHFFEFPERSDVKCGGLDETESCRAEAVSRG